MVLQICVSVFSATVIFFTLLRSIYPNDVFGMTVEDDITALLNIYCSCLAEKKSGGPLVILSLRLTPLTG